LIRSTIIGGVDVGMKRTIGIDNIFAAYAIAKPAFPPELPTNLRTKTNSC
jgi:hypothetical protein